MRRALQGREKVSCQHGFTLVEFILVIVLIGVLGSTVAVFIENPVRAYFDSVRRARLTDAADTLTRRMARDLRDALPNSVRIANQNGTWFVEFIPVRDLGRYRSMASESLEPGGTDALDFSDGLDGSFQLLGRPVTVPSDAQMVVFNLGSGAFDAYAGSNRRTVTTPAGSASAIAFTATGTALPADSPDHRVYFINSAVTYACTPDADGLGTVQRFTDYALQATQPDALNSAPLSTATQSLMLDGVSDCTYTLGNTLSTLNQMSMYLQLSAKGENVNLLTQVTLLNSP